MKQVLDTALSPTYTLQCRFSALLVCLWTEDALPFVEDVVEAFACPAPQWRHRQGLADERSILTHKTPMSLSFFSPESEIGSPSLSPGQAIVRIDDSLVTATNSTLRSCHPAPRSTEVAGRVLAVLFVMQRQECFPHQLKFVIMGLEKPKKKKP